MRINSIKRILIGSSACMISGAMSGLWTGASLAQAEIEDVPCAMEETPENVTCGVLRVFENWRGQNGDKIDIFFIRRKADEPDPQAAPIFHLEGGPGAAASVNAAGKLQGYAAEARRRDIILVDQRGTGRSSPLDCVTYDLTASPEQFQLLFRTGMFEPEVFRECRRRLAEHADLTQYTTTAIAHDINALREALGYGMMSLNGGSYGTRLALEIIRRHGAFVQSAVLLGVAPPTDFLVDRVASDVETMLAKLFASCEADAACSSQYPTFRDDFYEVLGALRGGGVETEFTNPGAGEPETVPLSYGHVATALRYALYSTQLSAQLPLQIAQAKAGDYSALAALQPNLLVALPNLVAEGMWASVKCSEEVQFSDRAVATRNARGSVMGLIRYNDEIAICADWPAGEIPSDFHDPVRSEVPVLLIAGELDVASPPDLARKTLAGLENGHLVILSNRSHWGLSGEPCPDQIVEAFLRNPADPSLETGCAAELERPPFAMPEDAG
ncbi:MAG: alpha/beta fold hydrolase [Parvularculaceae bacterium]